MEQFIGLTILYHHASNKDEATFSKLYPGYYLLWRRPSAATQPIDLQAKTVVPFNANNASTQTSGAKLTEQYVCYRLIKSARNVFPNGLTIGRTPNNDLVLPLETVSKFHAWLKEEPWGFMVFDAQSSTGTFVDNKQASPEGNVGVPLRVTQELRLGEARLTLLNSVGLYYWCKMRP